MDRALQGIDGVDRPAVGAEGRPVGDDDAVPEAQKLLAVPAPESAGRFGLAVIHGAEIEATVRPHMTVIDPVARLVGLRARPAAGLATPEIEPDEAGFESRDDDVGIMRERHESDPLGRGDA